MLKARIAVFVSGGGTNLQALLDAQKENKIPHGDIVLVVSGNPEAYALERAKKAQVEALTVFRRDYPSQSEYEDALAAVLNEKGIDMIILAGFMTILGERFVSRYPERIINVHPALIPSFCGEGCYGLRVHEAALRYG
ncbi:MAG: phosphoribosylglycinamide formyltransferase, partial [Clostridiales bacterium]|nr:phosphoribosylglycinamide formyltransferase [Clostridiales bacterium]